MFIGKGHNSRTKSVSYSRITTRRFWTFTKSFKFHVKHKRRGKLILLPSHIWSPVSKSLFGDDIFGINI